MRIKLRCTLRLKTDVQLQDIAEDINIVDVPGGLNDQQISEFFDSIRQGIKKKYLDEILQYFDVEMHQLQE